MSAWIVSKLHIDVLVQGLLEAEMITHVTPNDMGRTLWVENVTSVSHRYNRSIPNLPGPVDLTQADVVDYVYERPTPERIADSYNPQYYQVPGNRITPGVLLQLAECYDYQSCEHDGYSASDAAKYVEILIGYLTKGGARKDPAYERAPWGI